ncbi:hypothetical protein BH11CYA1_BH11CYA1_22130 [soil metagenome]
MTANNIFHDFSRRTANLEKSKAKALDQPGDDADGISKATLKLYKSFMQSYVKRINDATFNVTIGGVRIGSAKYTRLAQINLKTKVITFSRFAIENVPERGRRYLVLHELAHVHEASHNQYFWNLVGKHEPDYKDIGIDLDRAFKKNVQSHERLIRRGNKAGDSSVIYQNENLIWTPDHGYVASGSQQYGLHKDPVENFLKSTDSRFADEAFRAYVDLKFEDDKEQDFELDIDSDLEIDIESETISNENPEPCHFFEDDDYDGNYGTISGGDCLL